MKNVYPNIEELLINHSDIQNNPISTNGEHTKLSIQFTIDTLEEIFRSLSDPYSYCKVRSKINYFRDILRKWDKI